MIGVDIKRIKVANGGLYLPDSPLASKIKRLVAKSIILKSKEAKEVNWGIHDFPRGVVFERGILRTIAKLSSDFKRFLKVLLRKVPQNNRFDFILNEGQIDLDAGNFELRPYQREAVIKVLKNPYSLVSAPTGSGKTVIQAMVAKNLLANGYTPLFVAPLRVLLKQFEATYEAMFSEKFAGITITFQKLQREFEEYAKKKIAFIFDEAHTSALMLRKIHIKKRIHIPAYAFTATPFRLRLSLSNGVLATRYPQDINIFAVFSLPVFEIDRQTLEKEGYLASVEVRFIPVQLPFSVRSETQLRKEKLSIALSPAVLKPIVKVATRFGNRKTLIICDFAEQAKEIATLLANKSIENIYFVNADGVYKVSENGLRKIRAKKEIQSWTKEVEKENGSWVIVATTVFQVGVDIRSTEVVINAFQIGATETTLLQRLGRVTRPWPSKTKAFFIDFCWCDNKGFLSGLSWRRKRILEENGYEVKIVPALGVDSF